MGRPKKALKVKEPIRIRERGLANGNRGLYLDIYIKGTRKYESLGLYLVKETNAEAKRMNAHTRQVAEKIKNDRIIALQDRGISQYDKIKRSSMSLIDWLKQYEQDGFGFSQSTLKGRSDMRKKVENYLAKEKTSYIGMNQVDEEFCRGFLKYLATAPHAVCKPESGRTISRGCAHHHQAVLNGALNKAVRDGIIPMNPLKKLDRREKFQPSPEDREFLTIEELCKLMETPCTNHEVYKAFIFACFTGLRLSDVRTMSWEKVYETPDGKAQFVRTIMQKTDKPVNVPLSQEALKVIPPKGTEGLFFKLPSSDATINYHIQKWMKAAGITKHVSYHCSRHSFATMMLSLGADIYTVSKLLGHSNVTTTTIYAKIIDKKMIEAVELVNDMFESNEPKENQP